MPTIQEIADELTFADDQMRLELLLEYADRLPALPEAYVPLRDAGLNMVHECQSPVFLRVDVEDGAVRVVGDVPQEAPTARSFVSILIEAFDGEPPATVLSAPDNILHTLGLSRLLGMQRTQGLSAIYQRLRREVAEKANGTAA